MENTLKDWKAKERVAQYELAPPIAQIKYPEDCNTLH